ncbi:hypothetical protein GCM10022243_48450 [Saccharothrix violaceirubra]|uniref:Excisionase family DNA binding protein n=1 Tax=Saccharothrix violaceirubra TaxID=413306 RepID=A0A7W7WUU9_9PSEU|nr:hypothetical protein [Saccharothrix violaceirubra]MBB4963813.1 hypothetical protein [Saccharothrix violaceirubra]
MPPARDRPSREDVWLPADLLLVLLTQEAVRTGDRRLRVTRKAINTWVRRRHVRYERGRGYHVASVIDYLTNRGRRGLHRRSS